MHTIGFSKSPWKQFPEQKTSRTKRYMNQFPWTYWINKYVTLPEKKIRYLDPRRTCTHHNGKTMWKQTERDVWIDFFLKWECISYHTKTATFYTELLTNVCITSEKSKDFYFKWTTAAIEMGFDRILSILSFIIDCTHVWL